MKPDIGPFVTNGEVTADDMNAIVNAFDVMAVKNINDDYTLQAADLGYLITINNGVTVSIPTGLGTGFNCKFLQLDGGVGVTYDPTTMDQIRLNGFGNTTSQGGAYAEIYIIDDNTCFLRGDLDIVVP